MDLIKKELNESKLVLEKFIEDEETLKKINEASVLMVETIRKGGKIISCGNGGSMCDAMHFAEELSGKFREERKPLPAISISDPSHITCVGNDYGFDHVFSKFMEGVGKKGDTLLAISTSGNSTNIINAAKKAKEKGIKVISLTGKDGGKLSKLSDIEIRAPHLGYSDRIQEIHIKVIHIPVSYTHLTLPTIYSV